GHVAEPAAHLDVARRPLAERLGEPLGRLDQAEEELDRGALPRAVRAEEAGDRGLDLEVDVVEREELAVALRQALGAEKCGHGRILPRISDGLHDRVLPWREVKRGTRTFATAFVVAIAGGLLGGGIAHALQGGGHSQEHVAADVRSALVDVNLRLAGGGAAAGTGIVLTSSGEVLTNNHVIAGASSIRVRD